MTENGLFRCAVSFISHYEKKKKKKKREDSFSMRLPLFILPAGGDNIIRYVKLIEHTLKLELLPTGIEPMTFVL